MSNPTITVTGMDEIVQALQRLGIDMASSLEGICTVGAQVFGDEIASQAPGSIGEDVVVETTQRSASRVTVEAGPGKSKWYARFPEWGTQPHNISASKADVLRMGPDAGIFFRQSTQHPGMAAQPFMRPAFDTRQGAAQGEMAAEAKKIVDRAGR